MRLILILFVISITIFAQPVTVEIEALPEESTSTLEVKPPSILMIDNFEDGDLVKFREWWSFDKVVITPVENEKSDTHYIEKISLEVNASSNNWYAGGFGTYLNENASYFSVLKLVIYAPKLNAGTIRIELYDDDNNNKIVDISSETGMPEKDDLFIYDLNLTWEGWQVISIPLAEFVDFNPEVGDNIWNPNQDYGSSGLTQMQLVVLSSKFKTETIQFKIDTIKFN